MKIKRTANAGILLETDGITILLDGVCSRLAPYEATPEPLRAELIRQAPDAVLYTHYHEDHYDKSYAEIYKTKTLRSVYGPEFALYGKLGSVKLKAIPTRHIGKNDIDHVSYIIQGSKCVWFMGDASPLDAKKISGEKMPDVLIVPYAYVTTPSAWEITKSLGAKTIILLHMPARCEDPHMLWEAVENTVEDLKNLCILKIGESIII